jgi:hypothetical protein
MIAASLAEHRSLTTYTWPTTGIGSGMANSKCPENNHKPDTAEHSLSIAYREPVSNWSSYRFKRALFRDLHDFEILMKRAAHATIDLAVLFAETGRYRKLFEWASPPL